MSTEHPNKEVRAALAELEAAGWRFEVSGGHAWGRAYCPGGTAGLPARVDLVDAASP